MFAARTNPSYPSWRHCNRTMFPEPFRFSLWIHSNRADIHCYPLIPSIYKPHRNKGVNQNTVDPHITNHCYGYNSITTPSTITNCSSPNQLNRNIHPSQVAFTKKIIPYYSQPGKVSKSPSSGWIRPKRASRLCQLGVRRHQHLPSRIGPRQHFQHVPPPGHKNRETLGKSPVSIAGSHSGLNRMFTHTNSY